MRDQLLRGYSLNRRFEQVEDKLSKHDVQIEKHQKNIDFFVKTSLPPRQGIFNDGDLSCKKIKIFI